MQQIAFVRQCALRTDSTRSHMFIERTWGTLDASTYAERLRRKGTEFRYWPVFYGFGPAYVGESREKNSWYRAMHIPLHCMEIERFLKEYDATNTTKYCMVIHEERYR